MSFFFNCPFCKNAMECQDEWNGMSATCPYCNQTIVLQNNQAVSCQPAFGNNNPGMNLGMNPVSAPPPGCVSVQPVRFGVYRVIGNVNLAWSKAIQAMIDCKVKIKQQNYAAGRISGNCRYGINIFGIGVNALFQSDNTGMYFCLNAHFYDAFDTFGICSKKVNEIGSRFMQLCNN
ncbi:MAG: hypothetical protein IJW05_08930 [Lentisphaeria bacterium]|nr:hypothetical protein [Lentisphaeria bacterium]